jgi:hypothetical protein
MSSSIIGAESGILVFRDLFELIIMSKSILGSFKKNCIYIPTIFTIPVKHM